MNLSNYSAARNKFLSPFESNFTVNIVGEDINYGMTLILKDIKSLLSYCSAVHIYEPLLTDRIEVMKLKARPSEEAMEFETLLNLTKLNNDNTFYFQATTFVNKEPLIFLDDSLLGQKNTYKPFDSQKNNPIDTMITTDLIGIRNFSDSNFRFKTFRGLASFKRADRLKKGHTIYITDKDLYLTVIAARYSDINAYTGIIYTGA